MARCAAQASVAQTRHKRHSEYPFRTSSGDDCLACAHVTIGLPCYFVTRSAGIIECRGCSFIVVGYFDNGLLHFAIEQ